MKLVKGEWYEFKDFDASINIGQYVGRQKGFECCVCGKGCNAHTFNVYHNDNSYETWGYGNDHMPTIIRKVCDRENA